MQGLMQREGGLEAALREEGSWPEGRLRDMLEGAMQETRSNLGCAEAGHAWERSRSRPCMLVFLLMLGFARELAEGLFSLAVIGLACVLKWA